LVYSSGTAHSTYVCYDISNAWNRILLKDCYNSLVIKSDLDQGYVSLQEIFDFCQHHNINVDPALIAEKSRIVQYKFGLNDKETIMHSLPIKGKLNN
jgi:hypothetical protein